MEAEIAHFGGDDEDKRQAFIFYYDMCYGLTVLQDGEIFSPVFL